MNELNVTEKQITNAVARNQSVFHLENIEISSFSVYGDEYQIGWWIVKFDEFETGNRLERRVWLELDYRANADGKRGVTFNLVVDIEPKFGQEEEN